MAITLETLATGDTNYISKHNANNTVIKTAIDALQLSLTGASSSVVNFPSFANAILGTTVGRLALLDGVASDGGSAILDITSGAVWVPSAGQVRNHASASLDFTGQATNTYFTHVDALGGWTFDTSATDGVHIIAFTSPSTFTTITQPNVVWGDEVFQNSKVNAALGGTSYEELDGILEAIAGGVHLRHPVTMTGSDVTLTTAEGLEHGFIDITGTLTGDRDLIVPDFESVYIVRNDTGGAFDVMVRTSAQLTGPIVAQGGTALLVCDGTDVLDEIIQSTQGANIPYVLSAWKNGIPGSSERVLAHSFPDGLGTFTMAAGLTNSSCESETAATAETNFDVTKNDGSIGTIRWAISGTVATFVGFSEETFVAGDRIEITAPGSADATHAEIYFTLFLTRVG